MTMSTGCAKEPASTIWPLLKPRLDGVQLIDQPRNAGSRMSHDRGDAPDSSMMPFFDNVAPIQQTRETVAMSRLV